MQCKEARMLISPYIDGMLRKGEQELFEKHIETCGACRKELEDIKDVVAEIGELPERELPQGFEDVLHDRILREAEIQKAFNEWDNLEGSLQPEGEDHSRRNIRDIIKWIGYAAAVVAVAFSIKAFSGSLNNTKKNMVARDETAQQENKDMFAAESSKADRGTDDAVSNDVADGKLKADDNGFVKEDAMENEEKAEDKYIKTDKVNLKVEDVCVTPNSLEIAVAKYDIDVVETYNNGIKVKVSDKKDRENLYQAINMQGIIEDMGEDTDSQYVTIIIKK